VFNGKVITSAGQDADGENPYAAVKNHAGMTEFVRIPEDMKETLAL
jgi:hypothetical protein